MGRKHPRIPPALKIGPSSIVFSIGCLLLVFGLASLFSPISRTQKTLGKADITASLSRLILKLSGSDDDGAVAKFLVKSRNPNTGLRVRLKDEDGSPLVIIPSPTSKDPGVRLYEIHIRPGARLEEKIYHVLIESTDGSVAGTSLPILVSREDES